MQVDIIAQTILQLTITRHGPNQYSRPTRPYRTWVIPLICCSNGPGVIMIWLHLSKTCKLPKTQPICRVSVLATWCTSANNFYSRNWRRYLRQINMVGMAMTMLYFENTYSDGPLMACKSWSKTNFLAVEWTFFPHIAFQKHIVLLKKLI